GCMKQRVLEGLGLTPSEAKIYLVLLEQGSCLAGTISRNTGIHRRSVYDAIERLIQKGLVSYIKSNNRKYFEAVDPERLTEILNERKEDIESVMPELKLLQQMAMGKKETLFFRGKAALRSAFDDQVERKPNEICVWGASAKASEILPYYFPHYHRERAKRKIPLRIIFNETDRGNPSIKEMPNADIRFVPKEVASQSSVNIYGDNICIVTWKADPIAILIREKEIAEGYKNYFEFMWKSAKK
ncbi:hypothetical protein KY362_04520, partial [Candidatus Woesearchaeota archaeon]|nr:hypothetical protein [Candidatus Woesearchaeota archaeon]